MATRKRVVATPAKQVASPKARTVAIKPNVPAPSQAPKASVAAPPFAPKAPQPGTAVSYTHLTLPTSDLV